MIDEQHKIFRFYLEQVNSVDLLIEERTLYYQLYFDCIASSSHAVQMRHLHSSLPRYVNISSTLRLVGYQPEAQTLEGIYQEWFDKKGELEKTLKELKLKDRNDASSKAKKWLLFQKQLYKPMNTNETNIVQDENEDNESDDEVSIVDKKEMDSNDVIEVSYQTIIREITKKFYESKLGQLQQYKEDVLTQQPVDDVESEINNHSINEYNVDTFCLA